MMDREPGMNTRTEGKGDVAAQTIVTEAFPTRKRQLEIWKVMEGVVGDLEGDHVHPLERARP